MQNYYSKFFVSWRTTYSPRLDWTLVFVSFLSIYPSDTDNQNYSNIKTRIRNPISLVLILCTASFQICLWISSCVHQCFAHYYWIAPWKISNLSGRSLVSSWRACLFYRPFYYLQNVDFERSHKSGFESFVGNLLIAITKFIPRNAFSSSLVTVKFLPFWWA